MAWIWNDKQQKLIDQIRTEIHQDKDTVNVFVHGGLGSGKSVAILYLIDMICQKTPGMTFLIARRTYESLKTDTFNILKREPGILDASKGVWKANSKEFHYTNGSVIYFTHLEKSDSLLGPSYGGIYVEQVELCSEDDFRLLKQRLRQYGPKHAYHEEYKKYVDAKQLLPAKNYLFLSANPKNNWVKNVIVDNQNSEFTKIHLPTKVNISNLPSNYINENESEAFKRRFYEGVWESLAGLCYPEFTDRNIADITFEMKQYNKDLNRVNLGQFRNYIICDPGYVTSKFAVMFACAMPDNTIYIYDEISRNGKNAAEEDKVLVPEMATLIKQKIQKWGLGDYIGIIDYAANAKSSSGASITKQFNDDGIYFSNAIKSIAGTSEVDVIFKINSLFKQKKILINPRCVSTLRELELFSWKVDKNGTPNKDEPKDADNDFMDCLRYLINAGPIADIVRMEKTSMTPNEAMAGFMQNLFTEERPRSVTGHTRTALDFGL